MSAATPFALLACEGESTNQGDAPATPTGTFTAPPTQGADGSVPGQDGAAPSDAGTDARGEDPEAVPNSRTLKLVNLSAVAAINACVRRATSGDPFTGPLFRAAGIPINAASARVPLTNNGNAEVKIITAGEDCTQGGLVTQVLSTSTQSQTSRIGVTYSGGTGLDTFFENLAVSAGNESIVTQPKFVRESTFERDDGVGSPYNLRLISSTPVLIPGNLVGKIRSPNPTLLERPIKTKPGGTLSLWLTADNILLCDERAPAQNGLTDCSPALRAP